MSNMKDYMMWLVDRGFATHEDLLNGQRTLGDRDLYGEECTTEYYEDSKWHMSQWGKSVPKLDEDDYIVDDDDDDVIIDDGDDDEISNITISAIQRDILVNLLQSIVDPQPSQGAINGNDMGTDEVLQLWGILQEIENPQNIEHTAADHISDPDEGGRQLEFWMTSDGLTGDAQDYLQKEYLKGEFV